MGDITLILLSMYTRHGTRFVISRNYRSLMCNTTDWLFANQRIHCNLAHGKAYKCWLRQLIYNNHVNINLHYIFTAPNQLVPHHWLQTQLIVTTSLNVNFVCSKKKLNLKMYCVFIGKIITNILFKSIIKLNQIFIV